MTNPDSILKSKDIALSTKVCLVKATVFPIDIYEYASWTLKKAERRRIDAFELWCWRRLLRVPWTARRSNHSILKEISLDYSLEGLKLKLQYFGHLMQRTNSLKKTLMLGKTEGGKRKDKCFFPSTFLSLQFSSVQFSCSFVSNSLRPHESQHARPPCPLPTPGAQTLESEIPRELFQHK